MSVKQIKDILKGSLRFNQSQLEAEENEQITIEDDHYCSNNLSKPTTEITDVSISKQPYQPKQQVTCMQCSSMIWGTVAIVFLIAQKIRQDSPSTAKCDTGFHLAGLGWCTTWCHFPLAILLLQLMIQRIWVETSCLQSICSTTELCLSFGIWQLKTSSWRKFSHRVQAEVSLRLWKELHQRIETFSATPLSF